MDKAIYNYELKVDGTDYSGKEVVTFSRSTGHATLKDAFIALEKLGNTSFINDPGRANPSMVVNHDACIKELFSEKALLVKFYLYENDIEGFKEGVYLRRNTNELTREGFEYITGKRLPISSGKAADAGYHLMLPTGKRQKKTPLLEKITSLWHKKKAVKGKGSRPRI